MTAPRGHCEAPVNIGRVTSNGFSSDPTIVHCVSKGIDQFREKPRSCSSAISDSLAFHMSHYFTPHILTSRLSASPGLSHSASSLSSDMIGTADWAWLYGPPVVVCGIVLIRQRSPVSNHPLLRIIVMQELIIAPVVRTVIPDLTIECRMLSRV